MTKAELISRIHANLPEGMTKSQTGEVFDSVWKTITEALYRGETLSVAGFGTFSVVNKPEREGRNPRTGEPLVIPAKTVVRFKAGKGLKDALNT